MAFFYRSISLRQSFSIFCFSTFLLVRRRGRGQGRPIKLRKPWHMRFRSSLETRIERDLDRGCQKNWRWQNRHSSSCRNFRLSSSSFCGHSTNHYSLGAQSCQWSENEQKKTISSSNLQKITPNPRASSHVAALPIPNYSFPTQTKHETLSSDGWQNKAFKFAKQTLIILLWFPSWHCCKSWPRVRIPFDFLLVFSVVASCCECDHEILAISLTLLQRRSHVDLGRRRVKKERKASQKACSGRRRKFHLFMAALNSPLAFRPSLNFTSIQVSLFFAAVHLRFEKTRKSQLAASPGAGSWGSQFRVFFCKNRNKSCSSSPNRNNGLSVISIAANWQFSSPLCLQVVELGWKLFFFIGFQ